MNNPDIYIIASIVIIAILIYRFTTHIKAREYLALLDQHTWKSGRDIRKDMKAKQKRWWLDAPSVYFSLSVLEEQRLIEHRITPRDIDGETVKVHEYRLAPPTQ